jgi:pyruvate dehydrogenase E1 component beta subunit
MTEGHFDCFDVAPRLLASADTPIPFAGCLEEAWMPSCDDVMEAARELVSS